ncbi:hypothetical protein DK842_09160 [Chromobacterium phragmitis]|uniref:Uncharacterized protein n=1 Tax=Chromobacterium phragmitis TaxID=2202141 RepID=A0A344UJJ4_9NEIS|nr:hypothetical protein [Chromobacterium phragmitis]AXE30051.1 hypothetical protein DK842_09160 [Chromobacterium phragmitis]AXE35442.1 hypothetical protein DK843_14715 [Chromobacterium phragmitis]
MKTESLIFSRRHAAQSPVAARIAAILWLLAGCHAAAAGLVRADGESRLALRGRVEGPLSSGSKAEGTLFQAYYLRLARPLRLDDGAACGAQTMRRLALNQEGMGRYLGRRVALTARVFCQEGRTGTYHLADIEIGDAGGR